MTSARRSVALLLMVSALLAPSAALAQGASAYASFIPSVAVSDANTSLALTGAMGVRFNRAVAFEIELTTAPDFAGEPDVAILAGRLAAPAIFPAPRFEFDGRAVMFLTNARVFIPTTLTRMRPFFVAGGGLAHLRQGISYAWLAASDTVVPSPGVTPPGGGGVPTPVNILPIGRPTPFYGTSSQLALALNLGGGVSVDVWKGLSLDVDLRYYHLMGERDWNVGRFGIGAGYRF